MVTSRGWRSPCASYRHLCESHGSEGGSPGRGGAYPWPRRLRHRPRDVVIQDQGKQGRPLFAREALGCVSFGGGGGRAGKGKGKGGGALCGERALFCCSRRPGVQEVPKRNQFFSSTSRRFQGPSRLNSTSSDLVVRRLHCLCRGHWRHVLPCLLDEDLRPGSHAPPLPTQPPSAPPPVHATPGSHWAWSWCVLCGRQARNRACVQGPHRGLLQHRLPLPTQSVRDGLQAMPPPPTPPHPTPPPTLIPPHPRTHSRPCLCVCADPWPQGSFTCCLSV